MQVSSQGVSKYSRMPNVPSLLPSMTKKARRKKRQAPSRETIAVLEMARSNPEFGLRAVAESDMLSCAPNLLAEWSSHKSGQRITRRQASPVCLPASAVAAGRMEVASTTQVIKEATSEQVAVQRKITHDLKRNVCLQRHLPRAHKATSSKRTIVSHSVQASKSDKDSLVCTDNR